LRLLEHCDEVLLHDLGKGVVGAQGPLGVGEVLLEQGMARPRSPAAR
jgi:hypothetical protein